MSTRANKTRRPAYKSLRVRYVSRIRDELHLRGMTVEEFIGQMGCSRTLYFVIEQGKRKPTDSYRAKAARVLAVPEDRLFTKAIEGEPALVD